MKFIIALLICFLATVAFATVPPKDVGKKADVKAVKVVKPPVDKELTDAELAEVDAWVAGKVKSGAMTKKQGADAMAHAKALKKVMDSEKKPKKGEKHGN